MTFFILASEKFKCNFLLHWISDATDIGVKHAVTIEQLKLKAGSLDQLQVIIIVYERRNTNMKLNLSYIKKG